MSNPEKPVLQKPPGYRDPSVSPFNPPPGPPPPRKSILPTSYHASKKRSCCRTCCCITCLILFLMILFIGVIGSVFYLLLQPKIPVFHLQSVEFSRFDVTNSVDGLVLDSQAVVRIQVKNQNGVLKVNYGNTDVALRGGDVDLGKGTVPRFSQDTKNTTVLKLTIKVKDMLLESGSGKKVKDGFKNKSLKMGTEVNTEVGVGFKGLNTFKFPIKAVCEGESLKNIEGGDSVPKCKITILKLFNIKI